MSVYTRIEKKQLEYFLEAYDYGSLIEYEGISAGIENTNYFVTTTKGDFVLTLFESLATDELPYFLNLMAFLAEHSVPSAHPVPDKDNSYIRILENKPAALVQRLNGASVEYPDAAHCEAMGQALAQLHITGQSFDGFRGNERGPHWWKEMRNKLESHLNKDDLDLLKNEIDYQEKFRFAELPRGVIHADLFRDNALFVDHGLTGIIDFYYACNDALLYDVAVTVNDWCSNDEGELDEPRLAGFLNAYDRERPLNANEKETWPVMLRAAALRFWLSRLHDLHFPRAGEITHTKDPDIFKRILCHRIQIKDGLNFL